MGFKEAGIFFPIIALTIISTAHLETIKFDGEGCDKIDLVAAHQECPAIGLFSVPGDCTVFYKCLKENDVLEPFLEYCAKGYNFNGFGCTPNLNKTDCPQFHCIASLELSSNPSNTQENKEEENGVYQIESTKPVFTVSPENSSTEVTYQEASEILSASDGNSNSLDINNKKSKDSTAYEMPSDPIPYKSGASTYSYNLILQCCFALFTHLYICNFCNFNL